MSLIPIPNDWALMYMSISTYVLPFSLLGFYGGIRWGMERLKVSQGYIKCVFRTKNFRKRIKFMKPEEGIIKEKVSATEFKTLECPTDSGYIYFEGKLGSTPVIEYNCDRMPINFLPNRQNTEYDQATKDSAMLRVFNLGQRLGIKDLDTIRKYLLVCIIVSAISLAVLLLLVSGTISIGDMKIT